MGKNLMPVLGGLGIAGLAAMTGGASLPGTLAAAEGAGAAGAVGLGGAGLAGDALAAQGAAGLLGGAGAEAAGYGGASLLGGASGIAGGEIGSNGIVGLDEAMNASTQNALGAGRGFMGDGVSIGNTIEADGLTANSFTGGYDKLNGMERFGQRLQGMMDGGGSNNLSKAFKFMKNGQQQPQQQQGGGGGGAPRPMMQQQSQPTRSPYDPVPQYDEEQLRRLYGR